MTSQERRDELHYEEESDPLFTAWTWCSLIVALCVAAMGVLWVMQKR